MRHWIASALLLTGCSQSADPQAQSSENALVAAPLSSPDAEVAPAAGAVADGAHVAANVAVRDDGLGGAADAYVAKIKGHYTLWQNDRGDDGSMCEVELLATRTIGGYALVAKQPCLDSIGIADLSAWFVADTDDHLVLIDATRKPVARLKRAADGYHYFGNDQFYLSRPGG